MIGFLMGTSIAFFVVIGDLAPPIIANLTGVETSSKLRLVLLVGKWGPGGDKKCWILKQILLLFNQIGQGKAYTV